MSNTKKRKLRAILFADIVGYTSLMQKDETNASILLQKFRNTLNEEVTRHDGEVINNYGDGCLCAFESAVDAMKCAKVVQLTFQKEPIVPVRIGLHSGDVYFEDNNVFGDSVNIASRIESLGVAGAILFSKRIKRHVANQTAFEVQSLGAFHFKNVEKTMEVFALANDGFIIPKREEMKGKLKTKNWLVPFLVGALLLIGGFGIWKMNSSNGIKLMGDGFSNHTTPLPKEIREKRVAVMVFENQTMNSEMEAFGKMISDWVTRGLMETGEAKVISAANIQHQIAKAGLGQGANPDFVATTGVDVMLQGRYYLQENRLIIHANIVEIKSGEVIHALTPIEGDKSKMIELLDELTQEVLGYWAVKKTKRFLQNPPKYEAYKKYQEADKNWWVSAYAKQNEQLLQEAYKLDTNFYAPLLKLAILYSNPGGFHSDSKKDSVLNYIETKNPLLTKWENLRLAAIKEPNYLKRAQLNEQMYNMDASDASGNFNAALNYLFANMPQKTVELLEGFDSQFRDFEANDYSWREPRLSQAYLMLGKYDKIIDLAENYPYPKMLHVLTKNHLLALIEMDSIDRIEQVYEQYIDRGIYNGKGEPIWDGYLLTRLCDAFYIKDKKDLLSESVNRLKKLTLENKEDSFYNQNMGGIAFYQGDYEQAVSFWKKQEATSNSQKLFLHSVIGVGHALNGNQEKAEKQLSFLVKYSSSKQDERIEGRSLYHQGRILAALGRTEEAIQSVKMAYEKWNVLILGNRYKNDIFLKPLFGTPAFEELVRPK